MRKVLAAAMMMTSAVALTATPVTEAVAQSGETIRQIRIEGNQRIEDRTVQSYLLVSPGDPFDPARIDLSLKTLFATGATRRDVAKIIAPSRRIEKAV